LAKKPAWVIEKERQRPDGDASTFWIFGIHAVDAALRNPSRRKSRLVVTRNAADRLSDAITAGGLAPEIVEPKAIAHLLDASSVHQGAALCAEPLDQGSVSEICAPRGDRPLVVLLDRVSDPHNVGAILRSAEVFGARAVIAPHRHSSPETGALAKSASGALERQPYIRVPNLGNAMRSLREMGYFVVGLDGSAEQDISDVLAGQSGSPVALALGAEGAGLRELTGKLCDALAAIGSAQAFGSLNVSNAAAVALFAASRAAGRR
jgi:23S rRNA (guanosine2251-2'-O)-methyltransferase